MPQLDRRERFHNHSREGLCDPTVKWTLQELYILCLVSMKLNTNSKESRLMSMPQIFAGPQQAWDSLGRYCEGLLAPPLRERHEEQMVRPWSQRPVQARMISGRLNG